MKRLVLFVFVLSVTVQKSESQVVYHVYSNATSPNYSGGAIRGLYARQDGRTLVINITPNNLSNPASNYLVTTDGCATTQAPIIVSNLNLTASVNACIVGWAHDRNRRDTSVAFGNMISSATGNNCIFIKPIDASENNYRVWEMFYFTGPNKAISQISGATFLPNGLLRVWNNSHSTTPIEINGVAIPFVVDLNPVTGLVVPRSDLEPSLATPLVGVAKITSVDVTSLGEVITLGYFNRRAVTNITQKGWIENLSTSVIINLGVDNDAFSYTSQYAEITGTGYIGYTNSTPPSGLSSGVIKFNPLTYTLSAAGGVGFGINPMDMVIDNSTLIVVGSPRTTPVGGTVARYNPTTNLWTNLSSGLYTTPGASSSVNYVASTSCNCLLMAGNFSASFASGSPRASNFTDLVKLCDLGMILPSMMISFTGRKIDNDNILNWRTVTEVNNKGFQIQRSTNGINYSTIGFINSIAVGGNSSSELSYTFIDNNVGGHDYMYRLNQMDHDGRGTLSDIVVIKDKVSTLMVDKIYPNPVTTTLSLSVSSPKNQSVILNITDILGKPLLTHKTNLQKGSNAFQLDLSSFGAGTYFLKIGDANVKKVIVQ